MSETTISSKEAQIIDQVEHYFGDTNLPRDKFMLEEIKKDHGWIPLSIMLRFNRLARITRNYDEIMTALKKSSTGLVEVDAVNHKLRRSPNVPMPVLNAQFKRELKSRTAVVKGFPTDIGIDEILAFCKTHAPGYEKAFLMHDYSAIHGRWFSKGAIILNFTTKEYCQQFIDGPDVSYNGQKTLEKMWHLKRCTFDCTKASKPME